MRKFVSILLVLLGSQFVASVADGSPAEPVRNVAETLSVDWASTDVWLCERACNSDLNRTRESNGGIVSPKVVRPYTAVSSDLRAAARYQAALHVSGRQRGTLFDRTIHSTAVPHAVDYYVYRLRRLLI